MQFRFVAPLRLHPSISAFSFAMRVQMRRRSNSIFVSPGPHDPIPRSRPTRPPAWRVDSPHPAQSRQRKVLKLGEFHLSFARLGVLGKNIEMRGGAVHDLGVHDVSRPRRWEGGAGIGATAQSISGEFTRLSS